MKRDADLLGPRYDYSVYTEEDAVDGWICSLCGQLPEEGEKIVDDVLSTNLWHLVCFERTEMKQRISKTVYICDGLGCRVETEDKRIVDRTWLKLDLPSNIKVKDFDDKEKLYHNYDCAKSGVEFLSRNYPISSVTITEVTTPDVGVVESPESE